MGNKCCPPLANDDEPLVFVSRHTTSRRTVSAQATTAGWHPICTAADDVFTCIRLIHAGSLGQLPVPWPRSQDLSEGHFLEPECDTLVLAVSHGWMYQAHPDPTGAKGAVVKALLGEVSRAHCPTGHTLCFFDFCSVSQRAFRDGQAQRTQEEKRRFDSALQCMPNVYLLADAVLHVDMGLPLNGSPELVEEVLVQVDISELQGASLQQLGEQVQVLKSASPSVKLFDVVVTCDGMAGLSAIEVAQKVSTAQGRSCPVELRRLPFGVRNEVPVGERGWIYLERFVTMVKAAMVDEDDFERVCFSNSPAVLEQIRAGSARLRQAALEGEQRMKHELGLFFHELDRMHFSGASTDKILGTAGEPNQDDRVVVRGIMREMMLELPMLWSEEKKRQRQRRLHMAVSSGDAEVVEALLRAGADVNAPGKAGETCLHRASLQDHVEVARVLLKHRADVHQQDVLGNCAAHNVFLRMSDHVIDVMELLAPDRETLGLRNVRQISPLDRFHMWALRADGDQPFWPAMAYLERVWAEHPSLHRITPATPHVPKASTNVQSLVHTVHTVEVCGHRPEVDEWAPKQGEADVHVLVLCFGFTLPPELMRSFWGGMFSELRCGHSVKYFLWTRVGGIWRDTKLPEAQERLQQVIERLPLRDKFILVDDTHGMCGRILAKLRKRLQGVFLINPNWCVSDEVMQSASMVQVMQGIQAYATTVFNPEIVATNLVRESCWGPDSAGELKKRILEALEKESPDFFGMINWGVERQGGEWASSMAELYREGLDVPFGMPAVLMCSAFAPEAIVVQSTVRLQRIFSRSTIAYIPNSRSLFQVEGEEQYSAVLRSFEDLLSRVGVSV